MNLSISSTLSTKSSADNQTTILTVVSSGDISWSITSLFLVSIHPSGPLVPCTRGARRLEAISTAIIPSSACVCVCVCVCVSVCGSKEICRRQKACAYLKQLRRGRRGEHNKRA